MEGRGLGASTAPTPPTHISAQARAERPPSRQEARRRRQARHRARVRNGVRVAPVAYDAELLDFLVKTRWLLPEDASDARKVGCAITAAMRDASRS